MVASQGVSWMEISEGSEFLLFIGRNGWRWGA